MQATLLEYRLLTSASKNFQHRLLIHVETTDIKSVNVNIDFTKPMLSKLHNIGFVKKLMWYHKKKQKNMLEATSVFYEN